LLLGRRAWAFIAAVCLLINLTVLLPFCGKLFSSSQLDWIARIKIIQLNVCAPTRDYQGMTAFLKRENPDIVALEECAERCVNHLRRDGVLARYSYLLRKIPYRHRLVVLSKFPLKEQTGIVFHADPAILIFRAEVGAHPITLLVMHSTRPSSGSLYYRNQVRQFEQVSAFAKQVSGPFLMAGDFNTTPWGYSFRSLLNDSGLRNSMDGFGIQPSFPVFVPKFPKTSTMPIVPIDHVLVNQHFVVIDRRLGPDVGSDHLPVIVELGLKRGE
jgi:endonuclease/exonuclease/phosphatase (EEP) superfamily protein YafD